MAKKKFVKNEKGYEKSFEADWKAVEEGLKKIRAKGNEPNKNSTVKTSLVNKTFYWAQMPTNKVFQ